MKILAKEKFANCDFSGLIEVQRFAFLFPVYFYTCKKKKKEKQNQKLKRVLENEIEFYSNQL